MTELIFCYEFLLTQVIISTACYKPMLVSHDHAAVITIKVPLAECLGLHVLGCISHKFESHSQGRRPPEGHTKTEKQAGLNSANAE